MNMKKLITLLSGLLFLYLGAASALAHQTREVDFKGEDPAFKAAGVSTLPSLSERFVDDGDYFIVRGEKIFLRKDTGRIAVKFKPTAFNRLQGLSGQLDLQSDFIKQSLNLTATESRPVVEKQFKNLGIAIISTSGRPATSAQLRARIQSIAAADSVEYANPVFLSKTTFKPIIPTDDIVVRFTPDFSEGELKAFCAQHNLIVKRKTAPKLNIFVLGVNHPESRSALTVANSLNGRPGVVWAQPNFAQQVEKNSVDDPLYPDQWHLENPGSEGGDVDAEAAWAIQTGSPDITIAIVDDGVDLGHEDLDIWTNPGEIADNGVDDDNNGYVDDVHGWNFYDDNNRPDADYDNHHGTACAGVAAARGNNGIGVAGIAYGSKILPVKILGGPYGGTSQGLTTMEAVANGIIYAADHADVISCSWGLGATSDNYIMDAIDYAVENGRDGKGTPLFFATGNSSTRGGVVTSLFFSGWPAGDRTVAWYYIKDASGAKYDDAAWLDDIAFMSNDYGAEVAESFENVTVPGFPDGDWFSNGDATWATVNDASHAYGNFSVKSGAIGDDGWSAIGVSKRVGFSEGYLSYRLWVEAAPGDALMAAVHNGEEFVGYSIFVGEGISFPANYSNSIAVGASNDSDLQSYYSQWGEQIDFVAPSNGGDLGITTTDRTGGDGYDPTNYTGEFGGTSSATPLAAGVAALILSKDPELTASEVRTLMRDTCDKIGNDAYDHQGAGWNTYYGYGRVNAYRALLTLSPHAVLTIGASAGGSVTTPGQGDFTAAYGEVVDLVASPEEGFVFENWTGDVEEANNPETTITMDTDKTITANFAESVGSSGNNSDSGGCFISATLK